MIRYGLAAIELPGLGSRKAAIALATGCVLREDGLVRGLDCEFVKIAFYETVSKSIARYLAEKRRIIKYLCCDWSRGVVASNLKDFPIYPNSVNSPTQPET